MKIDDLTGVAAEAAEMAVASGLIYVADTDPGIRHENDLAGVIVIIRVRLIS